MPPVLDIDAVVTVRSSVLPLYLAIENGTVEAREEVTERNFVTTILEGNTLALRSYTGDFLSVREGKVTTSRFLGTTEKFTVAQTQYQYSLQPAGGGYLCFREKDSSITICDALEDTALFQLFSLMVDGMNVGKQLRFLTRGGAVLIPNLLDPVRVGQLREQVMAAETSARTAGLAAERKHDIAVQSLLDEVPDCIRLAANPIIMQLLRRHLSPRLALSAMRCIATDPRAVRMDLEAPSWTVPFPFSMTEWPPTSEMLCARVVFMLDDLDAESSTWAYLPVQDGLPQSTEVLPTTGTPLEGTSGSAWIFTGPYWTTNSAGAGSFWKQDDAMARYKYMNGEKIDKTPSKLVRVIEVDFVREYVARETPVDSSAIRAAVSEEDSCFPELNGHYAIV
jgi:hypothetical protein